MMTSSKGNIFRVPGHLCGEFTGPRLIPRTEANDAEFLMFSLIWAQINGWVNNGEAADMRRHRAHHDVTIMWGEWVYETSHPVGRNIQRYDKITKYVFMCCFQLDFDYL